MYIDVRTAYSTQTHFSYNNWFLEQDINHSRNSLKALAKLNLTINTFSFLCIQQDIYIMGISIEKTFEQKFYLSNRKKK